MISDSRFLVPLENEPPPIFVPIDILKWIPPIHPKFCSGGGFALIGNDFKPFGIKAGAYAIPAQYDSKDGGSSGFLIEAEIPRTPSSIAYEGSVSWRTGKYSNSGLALAGAEGTSIKLGAVSAGGFVDAHGNVGAYGSAGILGGGDTESSPLPAIASKEEAPDANREHSPLSRAGVCRTLGRNHIEERPPKALRWTSTWSAGSALVRSLYNHSGRSRPTVWSRVEHSSPVESFREAQTVPAAPAKR